MSLIYGHRGASGHAPENTLEAFRLAMDMGADGFELDVHLSKDGHLVSSMTKPLTGPPTAPDLCGS